jgi:hypothetical protein
MKEIDWATIVVGAAATVLGPVLGPFALLLFAAIVGALLPMSKEGEMTRIQGAVYIATCVVISLCLTGFAVYLVQKYTTIPGNIAFMPLAFGIAAGRPFILNFVERLFNAGAAAFESITRGGAR